MTPIAEVVAPRLLPVATIVAFALMVKGYGDVGEGFGAGVIVALAIALRYVVLGPKQADKSMPLIHRAPLLAAAGEFILEGLYAQKKIGRSEDRGYMAPERPDVDVDLERLERLRRMKKQVN